jgi:FtsH-binding integral membrane protein
MATSNIPPNGADVQVGEADYRLRLADEYKILQDKIDKIGAFRFTIKGWSVTAVIAASVASSTAKSLLAVVTISVGVAVMLAFFCKFEFQQVKLSRLFGDRARRLEVAFDRTSRPGGRMKRTRLQVPYLAHEIALMSMARGAIHRSPHSPTTRWLLNRWGPTYRLWRQSDVWFYVVLFAVSFAPILAFHWEPSRITSNLGQTITSGPSSSGKVTRAAVK